MPMVNAMYEEIWGNLLPPQILTHGLSNSVRNNVVTPPDAPTPDCMTCGACCKAFVCVSVGASDNFDPDLYWDITTDGENGEVVVDRFLRRDGESLACVGLSGTIGESVTCGIYETRPAMCRQFEAGSDRCHALRRAFGMEPFLTLSEMYDARKKLTARSEAAGPSRTIRSAHIRKEPGTEKMTIFAVIGEGDLLPVHTYHPADETWMQNEFDGLSVDAARELIESRKHAAEDSG